MSYYDEKVETSLKFILKSHIDKYFMPTTLRGPYISHTFFLFKKIK